MWLKPHHFCFSALLQFASKRDTVAKLDKLNTEDAMKEKSWMIIIGLLLVLQSITFLKLKSLEQTIVQLSQTNNIQSQLSSQIGQLEQNIKQLLVEQESIVEHAEILYGSFDPEHLTIPVTYLVTPKELTPNTTVTLEVDGVPKIMERKGTTFSYTEEQGLFEALNAPVIQITNGSFSKVERSEGLKVDYFTESFFPHLFIDFNYRSTDDKAGFGLTGTIFLNSKPSELLPETVKFVSANLVVMKNEVKVAEYPVDLLGNGKEFKEVVLLEQGETVTWTLIAKDSLHLEHRFLLAEYTQGAEQSYNPNEDQAIYDQNGKLLGTINRYH